MTPLLYSHESDYNNLSTKTYAENKIWMLTEEFLMNLSKAEIEHMYELPTKDAIDAFCRTLFDTKL